MDPDYSDGDGVESFGSLCGRASAFLASAAQRPGFGVVFTHEQFIRAVLLTALYPYEGPSSELMRRFYALRSGLPIPNGAIVRMRRDAGRWWVSEVNVT